MPEESVHWQERALARARASLCARHGFQKHSDVSSFLLTIFYHFVLLNFLSEPNIFSPCNRHQFPRY